MLTHAVSSLLNSATFINYFFKLGDKLRQAHRGNLPNYVQVYLEVGVGEKVSSPGDVSPGYLRVFGLESVSETFLAASPTISMARSIASSRSLSFSKSARLCPAAKADRFAGIGQHVAQVRCSSLALAGSGFIH